MSEVYRVFGGAMNRNADFSDGAAVEMYRFESEGLGDVGRTLFSDGVVNGYALGKKWLNVFVGMWLEDVRDGLLHPYELYECGVYPFWWLDSIFKRGD